MAPTPAAALSAESILDYMVKSLPAQSADSEQTPLVKDPYAAIALFSHACMLAVGFRLIGLGEDHKLGMSLQCIGSVAVVNIWQRHIRMLRMCNPYRLNGLLPLPTLSATHTHSPRWSSWSK